MKKYLKAPLLTFVTVFAFQSTQAFAISSSAVDLPFPDLSINSETNVDEENADVAEPMLIEGLDYTLDGSENLPEVTEDEIEGAYQDFVENKGLLGRIFGGNKNKNKKKNNGGLFQPRERDSQPRVQTGSRESFQAYNPPAGSRLVIEAFKNINDRGDYNFGNAPDGLREFLIVKLDGRTVLVAVTSTARVGTNPNGNRLSTPTGTWRGVRPSKTHRSNLWDGSPMPYSLFFSGGYAIHGVTESYYGALGEPASGGCLRLSIRNAYKIYQLASSVGWGNVTVKIHSPNVTPNSDHLGGMSIYQLKAAISQSMSEKTRTYHNYRNYGYRSPYWPSGM